jgi:hypothetical protein
MKALIFNNIILTTGQGYLLLFKKGMSFQVKGKDISQYEIGKSFFSIPLLEPHVEFLEEDPERIKYLMFD